MYLTQALHRALQQTPHQPATIFVDRVRTFAEHADRVARLAGGLRSLGVTDGERVAILALNSDRYGELLNAVPWADGVLNPVNTRWSASEITYSLAHSQTRFLVVDDAFAAMVPQLLDAYDGLRAIIHAGDGTAPAGVIGYEDLVARSAPVADARRAGDAIAGVFYTGGTTGFPKGVMLTHTNLLSSAMGGQATCPAVVPGGRVLYAAPLFHAIGMVAWTQQWLVGGGHVFVPAFEPVVVMEAIQRHGITSTFVVPTMLQRLVDHPEIDRHDLSSLRVVGYGGSPITDAVLRRAMAALPGCAFVQGYGMTELLTATLLGDEDHRRGDRAGSAGRAVGHTEVRIVDPVGNEVPAGTVGEVTVRGPSVMAGYWDQPEETAAAIRDGWMRTGDGGYLDRDGYLYVVDRVKDMIISGGENVYSVEVENAIGQHPAVAACAVIGLPDADWGERVHAVVVPKPAASVTLDELRAHTSRLIAGYKAPRSLEVVDALPMSGAGKVLKAELRARRGDELEAVS
jgi:acyl-CoA synthetase (AMP-forming)/AMP-acid ligase II